VVKTKKQLKGNSVRIIGGEFRGRRLSFPDVPGLRPTTDRVRETVFNWLQNDIVGARCIDLFSGSGALGFEALSRGAKDVTFVDQEGTACKQLSTNLSVLCADNATVVCSDASAYLERTEMSFDVVFLDPPFGKAMLEAICIKLEATNRLAKTSKIYLEAELSTDG
jgi:16S rRNA (guanine966-N2)-methyltransferase